MENELGLRQFLEERGHEYVVTADKEGENSELDKHLPDTDIVSLSGKPHGATCHFPTAYPMPSIHCQYSHLRTLTS